MHEYIVVGKVRDFLDNLTTAATWRNWVSGGADMPRQATSYGDLANGPQFTVAIGFRNGNRLGA